MVGPSDIAFIKGVIAFVLVAGTSMGALRMWLRARNNASPDTGRLLDALREENLQLRADLEARMAEIEERVDFTERRLVQDRPNPRLPGSTARTPV